MIKKKTTLATRFLVLGVLLGSLGFLSARSARSRIGVAPLPAFAPTTSLPTPQNNQQRPKIMDVVPIDAEGTESDYGRRAARQLKGHRYDRPSAEPMLVEKGDEIYGRIEEGPHPEPIPVSASDAIIVGRIIKVQPYLTQLQTSIYTEFTVQVEGVIRDSSDIRVSTNKPIVVDREGGVLEPLMEKYSATPWSESAPSLKLIRDICYFVKRIHQSQDLSILVGYELNGGSVLSLEDNTADSPYAQMNEQEFLNEVRKKVAELGS